MKDITDTGCGNQSRDTSSPDLPPGADDESLVGDEALVKDHEHLQQLIRDRVMGVVKRRHTGVYIVGSPGTGKTHTVIETLEKAEALYLKCNARMTPMGLFEQFAENPDHTFLLDDLHAAIKRHDFIEILLAALDGRADQPRLITYRSKDKEYRVHFRGGVICLGNIALQRDPLVDALRSRIVVLHHQPSDAMIAAFIRHLASAGDGDLDSDECSQVADYVIRVSRSEAIRLDLRQYRNAVADYRLWRSGSVQTHWTELVSCNLRLTSTTSSPLSTRAEKQQVCRDKILELERRYPGDTARQLAEWPHSRAWYYRIRDRVARGEG